MTTEFEREIRGSDQSAIIDLSYQNKPLLIAFGGMVGALGMPPFEFFKLTRNLDVNKIYLRDLNQTWYHSGLPGISDNIEESASFLRRKIDESNANKVVVFGNSMGGYAAIVFGVLIKADIVHAFSPQTFINDADYIRSKRQVWYVHNNFSDTYFDLSAVIHSHRDLPELHLYYDSTNELDKEHAMRLKSSPNVALHSFCGGGHTVIRTLRNSGELQGIIVSSLNDSHDKAPDAHTDRRRSFLSRLFGGRHINPHILKK